MTSTITFLFLKGRCTSENFVIAVELVQYCHKNGTPDVVLKLNFQKAFGSVLWLGLDQVPETKGFTAHLGR